jgi:hypothetical protein
MFDATGGWINPGESELEEFDRTHYGVCGERGEPPESTDEDAGEPAPETGGAE